VLVLAAKVLDVRSVDDVIAIAKMAMIDNVLAVMYIVASFCFLRINFCASVYLIIIE